MGQEVIITNTKKITEMVKEVVREQLIEFSKWFESKINNEDRILTRNDTADYLGISLSTLSRWTKEGKISSQGIGDRVYYKMSDIKKSLITIN
ncbi:helix-turn-helix domain-containing protein [Elizabethkingia bruuniana]|uniref:helix-turn-helix domain-containing protein n=1 Tax=Elizabethkingia bruuniana TaxID=1756149 RepID=UPI00241DE697|nr:helix-turn-helix domain-containing protein [Elizabethkingia bruuniana]